MFDEERIERELRLSMEKSYREYAEACKQCDEPLRIYAESELPSPDGSQTMLNATKRRTQAFEAYRQALQAFTDYVIDNKVPPHLLEDK